MQDLSNSSETLHSHSTDGAMIRGETHTFNTNDNIIRIFYQSVSRYANSPALSHENEMCTYGELNDHSNRLGRYLKDNEIRKGSYIPLIMDKGIDAIVSILGILKSSAAYVPLSPEYPPERIQFIFEDCNASCVVTHSKHVPMLNSIMKNMERRVKIICMDELPANTEANPENVEYHDRSRINRSSNENLDIHIAPRDPAYVIYTSGTTGKPKGVVNVHTNIVNMSLWCEDYLDLNESSRFLQLAALTFDVSVAEIFPPLISGGHVLIVPQSQKQSPEDLFDLIASHGVTLLALPPSLIYQLDDILDPNTEKRLSTLRTLISGGEKLLIGRIKNFLKLSESGTLRVLNVYGPTETTVLSSSKWIEPDEKREVGLLGKPIYNEQVYIVDEEMKLCAPGETGEIVIGGSCVAAGYLNDPLKTEASFIRNPFSDEEDESPVYRTGDLGRILENGDIEFVGRRDEQVKVRGFRIELGEIETVLGRHPGVKHAVVNAQEEDGGHKRLVAYIIPTTAPSPASEDLRQYILAELPEFMVPGYFQIMKEFPLNPNGKVDRKQLPRVDRFERQDGDSGYREPETEMEKEVARIWNELLKVGKIGLDDNFFSLGGDSIISIQVVSRLNRMGYKIKTPQLFKNPVLKDFAAILAPMARGNGSSPVIDEDFSGPVMLAPTQLWFFEKEFHRPDHWHQSLEFEIQGEMKADIIARVMDVLVKHHPMLRSQYTKTPAGIKLYVKPEVESVNVAELDLMKDSGSDKENKRIDFCNSLRSAIKMNHPPLMRVGLIRLDENAFHFIWIIHHTIVDTVSWKILLDQFQWIYNAIATGQTIALPPRSLSYAGYSRNLQNMLEDTTSRKKLDQEFLYWKKYLTDSSYRSSFNDDPALKEITHADSKTVQSDLSEEMTGLLVGPAHECYNTRMPDLLLSALYRALARLMNTENLAIQLEGHGRERDMDLTETVGWFTTLFPFFMTVKDGESISDTIIHIKENRNAIPENGNNFLLLRYGAQDPMAREVFDNYRDPDVVFNYHGRFDAHDVNENWTSLPPTGPNFHEENQAPYKMNIECWIADDRLHTEFIYLEEMYDSGVMKRFVDNYTEELTHIIKHCLEPSHRTRTPSDFDLIDLTMEDIRRLPAGMEDAYDLSSMQNGMLFRYLLNPDTHAYHIQTIYDIEENIDTSLMAQAFNLLVKKYSILRTVFLSDNLSRAVQLVKPYEPAEIECVDLTDRDAGKQQDYIRRFHEEDLKHPFDPAKGPLFRIKFFKLRENSYRMSWIFHHIILDGWSYGLLRHEWLTVYAALKRGENVPEIVEAGAFKNFIEFHLEQHREEESKQFWKEQLDDFKRLIIPTDRPRLKSTDHTVRALRKDLPEELKNALKKHSAESGLTLNEITLAAYLYLLHILSDQDEVTAGFVVSGRAPELPHSESMMGLLINSVPFRVKVQDTETFAGFTSHVRDLLLSIKEHENFPLTEIIKLTDESNETGRGVFEHLFDYEKYPAEIRTPGMPDIKLSDGFEVTEYEITLQIIETDDLTVQFSYASEMFNESTMEQWFSIYEKVLRAIIHSPHETLSRFDALTDYDRAIIQAANDTAATFAENETLMSLFEKHAERYKDRPALIFQDESITYDEFNRRANQLARLLREKGVGPDDLVGLMCERSFEMLLGIYAIQKAGGGYLPMDPTNPEDRIQFIMEDSNAKLLLTQKLFMDSVKVKVETINLEDAENYKGDDSNLEHVSNPENLAYCIYTSGSTGKPKGVLLEQRSVLNTIDAMQKMYPLGSEDRYLLKTTYTFDVSVTEIYGWFFEGGALAILPPGAEKEPATILNTIERHRATHINFAPSMLQALLGGMDEKRDRKKLESLKYVLVAGEAFPPALVRQFRQAVSKSVRLENIYGPTENTIYTTYYSVSEEGSESIIPIGKALQNVRCYVIGKKGKLQPVGVPGELCASGAGVARGYLNRPELTEKVFVENPVTKSERMYRTGDLVRLLPDGNIEYMGRFDHQVKIRGYRIEIGEIESDLRDSDLVSECLVMAKDSETRGKFLIAYVVPVSYSADGENQKELRGRLEKQLKAKLPDYMIPSAFVFLNEFPLNASGKIDRKSLPDPEWGGTESYVAPRTETEILLADIWNEILEVDQIGIHDNFFNLGGHSILATRLASRIRERAGVEILLQSIFAHPVLEELASHMDSSKSTRDMAMEAVERTEIMPLSFAQQRLWFIEEMLEGESPYIIPASVTVRGNLRTDILEECLNDLIQRHESLRTAIDNRDGNGVQIILDRADAEIHTIDLTRLSGEKRDEELQSQLYADANRTFDLTAAPLFRTHIYKLADDQYVLLIVMHHIISDGWSLGVLLEEMFALYRAKFSGDSAFTLPEKNIDYVDFALWQRKYLKGDELNRQISYWKEKLDGDLPILELPSDHTRPAIQKHEGKLITFRIDPENTRWLQESAQKENATLFMALISVFYILLYRYTGQADIIVGSPIANRNRNEIEKIIGFFVNTLALRIHLEEDMTFSRIVSMVRETALSAYDHQDVPFEKLVEELKVERDTSRNPIFQTMFVFQNAPLPDLELPEIQLERYSFDPGLSQFDLTMNMEEIDNEVHGSLTYNTSIFDHWRMEAMVEHFLKLVESIRRNPAHPINRLEMLLDRDLETIRSINETGASFPESDTLMSLFEKGVEKFRDRTALLSGNESMTYGELNAKANQLARLLRNRGVGPDTLVGLMSERSFEMMIAIFAIQKAGGGYMPVAPTIPEDRIRFMMEDSGALILLNQTDIALQGDTDFEIISLNNQDLYQGDDSNPEHIHTPESLAYCIYTSGSTGKPKGVLLEHRSVVNMMDALQKMYPLNRDDRYLLKTAYTFDVSVTEIFGWFFEGGALAILPPGGEKDPAVILETVKQLGATHINFAPTMLQALLNGVGNGSERDILSGLKYVFVAGEAFPPALVRQFREMVSRDVKLENIYGPTENTIYTTFYSVSKNGLESTIPIGRPLQNVQCHIFGKNNTRQPVGIPGELCASGTGLARGYLNRPELTEKVFVENPLNPSERMYRTGDLVRLSTAGEIEYLGRIDHQVKIRGFRIEPGEIENDLRESEFVRECLVIPRDSEVRGKYLAAYVIPVNADKQNENWQTELRSKLEEHLLSKVPEYMVPSAFVFLDEFPLNASGKIDRKSLPDPEWSGSEKFVEPQTEKEKILSGIWSDVLGIQTIGIHDNFFELGGDSIISIQIISRAKQHGLKINVTQIFQYKTIQALAAQASYDNSVVVTEDAGYTIGTFPLSAIQRWFFESEYRNPHHFNQAHLFELDSAIQQEHIQRALNAVYDHHDILRATYGHDKDNRVLQSVHEKGDVFPFFTVNASPSNQSQKDVIRAHFDEAVRSLNIFNGPLCAAVHFHRAEGSYLYIVIHHLAVDVISWQILMEDLTRTLEAVSENRDITLPQKTTSYRRWLDKVSQYVASDKPAKEAGFWKQMLEDSIPPVPVDRNDGENLVGTTQEAIIQLSDKQTEHLLRDVPAAYNTRINDILLAGLGAALANWMESDRVLIHMESHGREELFDDVDISRTIGWFTSLYPVKLAIPVRGNTGDLIKSVKEQLRAIPHNGIGYGMIRYLGDETLSSNHLPHAAPEISFNYLGQLETGDRNSVLRMSRDRSLLPPIHGPENLREYKLDIIAYVAEGKLNLSVLYSKSLHDQTTIDKLLSSIAENIDGIISHCISEEAGGFTPSDFPLADLNQKEVDSITEDTRVVDIYPLSPVQRGLLFHTLLEQGKGVYVNQMSWRMTGPLDLQSLLSSWQMVLERHDSLRASFLWNRNGMDLQIIRKDLQFPCEILDWRKLSPQEQKKSFEKLMHDDRNRGFDLMTPPLMRLFVIREDENVYRIAWSNHHILLDGWCLGIILRELFEGYIAISRKETPNLALPVSYKNHISSIMSKDIESAREYWKKTLAGFEPTGKLQLPGENENGEHIIIKQELTSESSRALRQFTRNASLTLNTVIQSALAILLSRYTGSDDIIFGMVSSGRGIGSENIVGLMLNTLPLRLQISQEQSVHDFLTDVQQRALQAREYEYASLTEIRSWAELKGQDSLFDMILTFENYPLDRSLLERLDNVRLDEFEGMEHPAYDLNFIVVEDETISIQATFHTSVIKQIHGEQLLRHLANIILKMMESPEQVCGEISLLDNEEYNTLVHTWNQTERALPASSPENGDTFFLDLFYKNVDEIPHKAAVFFKDRVITYKELNELSDRVAASIRSHGVQQNQLVAILLDRRPEVPAAMIGIWKAGCAYVPIDPTYPEERIAVILEEAGVSIVVTENSVLIDLEKNTDLLQNKTIINIDNLSSEHSFSEPARRTRKDDPAYVIYTSGTTGKPKGIINTHGNVINLIGWSTREIPLTKTDRTTQFASFSFDVSVAEIYPTLAAGATSVILEQERRESLTAFMELLKEKEITVTSIPPALLYQLLDIIEENDAYRNHFAGVRRVICGGDALLAREVNRFQTLFGETPSVLNVYGPTETTVLSTYHPVPNPVDLSHPVVSLGMPIDNTKVYILDQYEHLCPVSVVGELCISGSGVANGYLGDPEKSAEKFIADPFANHGMRLYKTGDLGRWMPDGTIEFVGRVDHQVKIRGFRVETSEIDNVIQEMEDIYECHTIVHENENVGKYLTSYVIPADRKVPEEQEQIEIRQTLESKLKQKLPEYMIPSAFVFIAEFPLTANGKIDRKALPVPDLKSAEEYIAPRTMEEEQLLNIWSSVLETELIGIRDNFFRLGGHSLKAMSLISKLNAETEHSFNIADIYTYPTIEKMAMLMGRDGQSDDPEMVRNHIRKLLDETSPTTPHRVIIRNVKENETHYPLIELYVQNSYFNGNINLLKHYLLEHSRISQMPHRIYFVKTMPDDSIRPQDLILKSDKRSSGSGKGNRIQIMSGVGNYVKSITESLKATGNGVHMVRTYSPALAQQIMLDTFGTNYFKNNLFLRIDGIEKSAIEKSVNALIHRHAALRTVLAEEDGRIVFKEIVPSGSVEIPFFDLSGMSPEKMQTLIHKVATKLTSTLTLDTWPNFNIFLVKESERSYRLTWIFHHIFSDAGALSVLYKEFGTLCNFYSGISSQSLPEIGLSYVDWSEKINQQLSTKMDDVTKDYLHTFFKTGGEWKQLLYREDEERITLVKTILLDKFGENPSDDPASSEKLSDIFLATFMEAVHRWSGKTTIPVAGVNHGRIMGEEQYFDIVGDLTDRLLYLAEINDTSSMDSILTDINRSRDVLNHQNRNIWALCRQYSDDDRANIHDLMYSPFYYNFLVPFESGLDNKKTSRYNKMDLVIQQNVRNDIFKGTMIFEVHSRGDQFHIEITALDISKRVFQELFDTIERELHSVSQKMS